MTKRHRWAEAFANGEFEKATIQRPKVFLELLIMVEDVLQGKQGANTEFYLRATKAATTAALNIAKEYVNISDEE